MPERIGTDVDEINLENLFRQLNYTVSVYRNLCAKVKHKHFIRNEMRSPLMMSHANDPGSTARVLCVFARVNRLKSC